MQKKKIELSTGETIAYFHEGHGEKILLIHGNLSASDFFIPTIDALKSQFEIYAIDLRGFGDSSYNNKINSLYDLSLDASAFISELDLHDLRVLGWSMGGGVVLEILKNVKVSKNIRSAILMSPVGTRGLRGFDDTIYLASGGYRPHSLEKFNDMIEFTKNFEIPNIAELYRESLNKGFENMSKWYKSLNLYTDNDRYQNIKNIYDQYVYNVKKPSDEEFDRNIRAAMKQRNSRETNHALNTFDIFEGGFKLSTPTLYIHGLKDLVVNPYSSYRSIEELGSMAYLKIFNNSGHAIMIDEFEEYIQTISDFFR